VIADPRDGSIHDDYVYEGWESLEEGRRYGHAVPRVFTPPLVDLTPETSWGFAMIMFARDVLGMNLDPWQRWLAIHLLELRGDRLRFATVIILVARQNGKSTFVLALILFLMVIKGWPMTLGTAQDLSTAEELWEDTLSALQEDEQLRELVANVRRVNGQKEFKLLIEDDAVVTRSRYVVKAASRRAGRGLRGNTIVLDELREQQNWQAWAAITKTSNAQANRLIIGLSNAGDVLSVVLAHFRLIGHASVGDPDGIVKAAGGEDALKLSVADVPEADDSDEYFLDDMEIDEDTLFLAEWSAAPGTDKFDRDGWAQANPSLGHRMRIGTIASDAKNDPEWVFRTEVLCQWPDGTLEGPFPPGTWEESRNIPVERADGTKVAAEADKIVGPVVACIDQSYASTMTYIALCGKRADGVDQVEVAAMRSGSHWVSEWLMERKDRIKAVTGQKTGAPISGRVADLMEDPAFTIPVIPLGGGDLMAAWFETFNAVKDAAVRHNVQGPLDVAAATAQLKSLGAGKVIDPTKSMAETSPLQAFSGALWLWRKREAPIAPPVAPAPVKRVQAPMVTQNVRTMGF